MCRNSNGVDLLVLHPRRLAVHWLSGEYSICKIFEGFKFCESKFLLAKPKWDELVECVRM